MPDREELFDRWASSYDDDLDGAAGYPFEGYPAALDEIARIVADLDAHRVLELGVGTGALTERLTAPEREVCGIDLSNAMLERARRRVPSAELHLADVSGELPDALAGRTFDVVVSAYLFHEFRDNDKLELLDRLAERMLTEGGAVAIADIAFATRADRDRARTTWAQQWDASEHPWVLSAIEDGLRERGWTPSFAEVSFCAGVLKLVRRAP